MPGGAWRRGCTPPQALIRSSSVAPVSAEPLGDVRDCCGTVAQRPGLAGRAGQFRRRIQRHRDQWFGGSSAVSIAETWAPGRWFRCRRGRRRSSCRCHQHRPLRRAVGQAFFAILMPVLTRVQAAPSFRDPGEVDQYPDPTPSTGYRILGRFPQLVVVHWFSVPGRRTTRIRTKYAYRGRGLI
jgi:hypothetical protein